MPSSYESYDTPDLPALVTPNHPSFLQLASGTGVISRDIPVYLFNFTGGTGGNGGQSQDGVAGQGGHGEGPILNNNNYYGTSPEQEKAAVLRELFKAVVPYALYDSAEHYTYALCHPNTRTKYLSLLQSWSCNKDTCNTLWMHGPAGTGKSSIARSFCEQVAADNHLGANFFFKRGDSLCGSARGLFPTLAYQLAVHSAEFATAVAPIIQKDPSIVNKTLAIQFQRLIIEPWNIATPSAATTVIVIDALDECQGERDQQEILHCILKTSLSLQFLVISRPEPQIQAVLGGAKFDYLEIRGSEPDVQRYLVEEFQRIRSTHKTMRKIHVPWLNYKDIPSHCAGPWPGYQVINYLVDQSSGHFIYASTVIQFIDDPDSWPVEQVEFIMKKPSSSGASGSPFAALDNLYIQILRAVPHSNRPTLLQIVWIIAYREFAFGIQKLAQFLQIENVMVSVVLRRLHSILDVPVEDLNREVQVRHRSFLDFLDSPARAKEFAFTADARNHLALKVLDWCSVLHKPRLTSFDELSDVLSPELLINPKLLPEIVERLYHLNLDVLLGGSSWCTSDFLSWLELQGAPATLLKQWKDYSMLEDFDRLCQKQVWIYKMHHNDSQQEQEGSRNRKGFGSKLLQVVQGYIVLGCSTRLVHIKELLNYSWEELKETISPVRSESDGGSVEFTEMIKLFAEARHALPLKSYWVS
ncbi:hypothetical protein R3P38DRAFT_3581838 [Favolaschia claudopus]|uniref:Nephrocystin 3-like N-terminal domain-containing protein n=1 Tax=Favolaschia claudopus TaxID=2862362 RepID=A0AAW0AKZ3_9AGAR